MAPHEVEGVVTKVSPHGVPEIVERLVAMVEDRGMKVFAVIDHSGEADRVGLELRDTKLVLFGNPKGGTPAMEAVPLVALELPLKVLIWDDGGETKVSYAAPRVLAERYGLSDEVAAPLAGIEALTDALVAG